MVGRCDIVRVPVWEYDGKRVCMCEARHGKTRKKPRGVKAGRFEPRLPTASLIHFA